MKQKISFWDSAPQVLQQLEPHFSQLGSIGSLRLVFLSGDWIPLSLAERVERAERVQLVALGGATEVTVWSNSFEVRRMDPRWRSVPYGRPIWNHQYYCVFQGDAGLSEKVLVNVGECIGCIGIVVS